MEKKKWGGVQKRSSNIATAANSMQTRSESLEAKIAKYEPRKMLFLFQSAM
jgi:hypothetical protein